MKRNVNERVTVRLTEHGMAVLDTYEARLNLPRAYRRHRVTDGNQWRGELWSLMELWGPTISHHSDVPFVDNVIEFADET